MPACLCDCPTSVECQADAHAAFKLKVHVAGALVPIGQAAETSAERYRGPKTNWLAKQFICVCVCDCAQQLGVKHSDTRQRGSLASSPLCGGRANVIEAKRRQKIGFVFVKRRTQTLALFC